MSMVQVNLCQKLLFLHQLTHYMKTKCSLNYKFNTWKFQAQNMGRTCCVQKLFLTLRTISVHNMFSPCSSKRRASDKDLPVSWKIYKEKSVLGSKGRRKCLKCLHNLPVFTYDTIPKFGDSLKELYLDSVSILQIRRRWFMEFFFCNF